MTNLRGFAILKTYNPDLMRQIASRGGHAAKNRHKWTSEEAVIAAKRARANDRERKGEEGIS